MFVYSNHANGLVRTANVLDQDGYHDYADTITRIAQRAAAGGSLTNMLQDAAQLAEMVESGQLPEQHIGRVKSQLQELLQSIQGSAAMLGSKSMPSGMGSGMGMGAAA